MFITQTGKHSLLLPSPSPCRPFACAICGAKFASLQALGGHKSAHRDGGGVKARAPASTKTCGAAAGGKRRRDFSPDPQLRGLYYLHKDAPRFARTAEVDVVESEPQPLPLPLPLQPRVTGAPPQQPLFEVAAPNQNRQQPSGNVNALAARPPRLTRIDSSTRSSDVDTRHSSGIQSDGNQTRNQSGSSDTERTAILANILQELGRLKRQKVSMSSADSDAAMAALSGSRGVGSGASDAAMAAADATLNVTLNAKNEDHDKENEQEARWNVKNEKDGKEDEVLELNLFCSSGADTEMESGSSGSACGKIRPPPLSTAQHPSAPAPVLDLALHL
ncbi:unnamed protein product [Closterium sp. NIES-53]